MLAGQPQAAAERFGRLALLSEQNGLRHATAIYTLLAAMCLVETGQPVDLDVTIEQFLSEFRRATGHGGRADAELARAYEAAIHNEIETATRLLDDIGTQSLAHHASYLFARRAAQLVDRGV